MSLPEQRFTGITQERFAELAAKVRQLTSIEITSNRGSAAKSGYGLSWLYDPAAKVLAIQILAKPWYAPEAKVRAKIRELVEG